MKILKYNCAIYQCHWITSNILCLYDLPMLHVLYCTKLQTRWPLLLKTMLSQSRSRSCHTAEHRSSIGQGYWTVQHYTLPSVVNACNVKMQLIDYWLYQWFLALQGGAYFKWVQRKFKILVSDKQFVTEFWVGFFSL